MFNTSPCDEASPVTTLLSETHSLVDSSDRIVGTVFPEYTYVHQYLSVAFTLEDKFGWIQYPWLTFYALEYIKCIAPLFSPKVLLFMKSCFFAY